MPNILGVFIHSDADTTLPNYSIRLLGHDIFEQNDAVELLLRNCPCETGRYGRSRLVAELTQIQDLPIYTQFFGAFVDEIGLVGVGGIKATDWASNTHVLFLAAVEKAYRGQGIGTALEDARLKWLKANFDHGRCLVSTRHEKRFSRRHFKTLSKLEDKYLMLLEF